MGNKISVAELYADLGFDIDNVKLNDFARSLGNLNLSTVLSTLGLKGLYDSLVKVMSSAERSATGISNFDKATGISTKDMQQFAIFAEKMGASSDEAYSAIKGLQNAILQVQLGRGNIEPFVLAKINPYDKQTVFQVIDKIRSFLKDPAVNDAVKRMIASEFGLSDAMIAVMKSGDAEWESQKKLLYTHKETVDVLMKYRAQARGLGADWQVAMNNIAQDMSPVVTKFLELVDGMAKAIVKSPVLRSALIALSVGIGVLALALAGLGIAGWVSGLNLWALAISGAVAGIVLLTQWINKLHAAYENLPFIKRIKEGLEKAVWTDWGPKFPSIQAAGNPSGNNTQNNNIDIHISGSGNPEETARNVEDKLRRMLQQTEYQSPLLSR